MSEEPKEYNAGDPEQVKGREKKQKTRDLQKRAALRRFLSDPGGRMWMWDLLVRCGAYHSSFSTDALQMAFNEGRRDVGNHLIADINRMSPEVWMEMAAENYSSQP